MHSVRKVEKEIVDGYFKFAFVRNPWDRIVAVYEAFFVEKPRSHQVRNKKLRIRKKLFKRNFLTFEQFINKIHDVNNHHWEKQIVFVPDDVDFVGRFETFQRDIDTVLNIIGIKDVDIKHMNKSDRGHYSKYYSDKKMINAVARLYRDDIERFGYSFGDD
jgi:hypothetical protein